jgi:hypothetical protein
MGTLINKGQVFFKKSTVHINCIAAHKEIILCTVKTTVIIWFALPRFSPCVGPLSSHRPAAVSGASPLPPG